MSPGKDSFLSFLYIFFYFKFNKVEKPWPYRLWKDSVIIQTQRMDPYPLALISRPHTLFINSINKYLCRLQPTFINTVLIPIHTEIQV